MLLFTGRSDASEEDLLVSIVAEFDHESVSVDHLQHGRDEILVFSGNDGRVADVVRPDAEFGVLGSTL